MNRRDFLKAAPIAAVSLAATGLPAASAPEGFHRLSVEKDDPGFVPLGKLNADGVKVKIFLDDIEQQAVTVDARDGWVKRFVRTDKGNVAHNGGRALTEIVHGAVRIELS